MPPNDTTPLLNSETDIHDTAVGGLRSKQPPFKNKPAVSLHVTNLSRTIIDSSGIVSTTAELIAEYVLSDLNPSEIELVLKSWFKHSDRSQMSLKRPSILMAPHIMIVAILDYALYSPISNNNGLENTVLSQIGFFVAHVLMALSVTNYLILSGFPSKNKFFATPLNRLRNDLSNQLESSSQSFSDEQLSDEQLIEKINNVTQKAVPYVKSVITFTSSFRLQLFFGLTAFSSSSSLLLSLIAMLCLPESKNAAIPVVALSPICAGLALFGWNRARKNNTARKNDLEILSSERPNYSSLVSLDETLNIRNKVHQDYEAAEDEIIAIALK